MTDIIATAALAYQSQMRCEEYRVNANKLTTRHSGFKGIIRTIFLHVCEDRIAQTNMLMTDIIDRIATAAIVINATKFVPNLLT